MIGRDRSRRSYLQKPGDLVLVLANLKMELGVQEILGLVPTHWWVRPGPKYSAGPLEGRTVSWDLTARPGVPRAGIGRLVGATGS